MNTKPGGGNKPQPYIPKGNGDKSGEYTNKTYSSINEDGIRNQKVAIILNNHMWLELSLQYSLFQIINTSLQNFAQILLLKKKGMEKL